MDGFSSLVGRSSSSVSFVMIEQDEWKICMYIWFCQRQAEKVDLIFFIFSYFLSNEELHTGSAVFFSDKDYNGLCLSWGKGGRKSTLSRVANGKYAVYALAYSDVRACMCLLTTPIMHVSTLFEQSLEYTTHHLQLGEKNKLNYSNFEFFFKNQPVYIIISFILLGYIFNINFPG